MEITGFHLIRLSRIPRPPLLESGVKLLELAQNAARIFQTLPPDKKRELLQIVCSNSTWKDGELDVALKEPFEQLRVTNTAWQTKKAEGDDTNGPRPIWLPDQDSNLE